MQKSVSLGVSQLPLGPSSESGSCPKLSSWQKWLWRRGGTPGHNHKHHQRLQHQHQEHLYLHHHQPGAGSKSLFLTFDLLVITQLVGFLTQATRMRHAVSDVNMVTNKHKCDTRARDWHAPAKNKKTNFHRECFTSGLPWSKREEDQLSKSIGILWSYFCSDLQMYELAFGCTLPLPSEPFVPLYRTMYSLSSKMARCNFFVIVGILALSFYKRI